MRLPDPARDVPGMKRGRAVLLLLGALFWLVRSCMEFLVALEHMIGPRTTGSWSLRRETTKELSSC
jgi:hypothetical protein